MAKFNVNHSEIDKIKNVLVEASRTYTPPIPENKFDAYAIELKKAYFKIRLQKYLLVILFLVCAYQYSRR